MSTSVFVSGASGFIAQHIVKLLLSKGYNVVGTVRSTEKGERLKTLFRSNSFQYEVVEDIDVTGAFDEALKNHPEVTVFLHTASPFHYKATDIEKEMLLPAVNGTKNALKAIQKYGPQIKRVVVTSSYVAMWDVSKFYDPTHTDSEDLWNPISWEESKQDAQQAYYGSKKFAEQAAWEFLKEETPNFTITYVNPVLVFGPQAFDEEVKPELNASSEIINSLLRLSPDSEITEIPSVFVDVRDVARAHLVAFEQNLPNERLLLFSQKYSSQGMLDIINDNFDTLKGKLPLGTPGTGAQAEAKICHVDNAKTRNLLGFPLIDLKTSVVDTVAQILRSKSKKK